MSEDEPSPLLRNPFSAMAVASLTDFDDEPITIDTSAVRLATSYVRTYMSTVATQPRSWPDGNVILLLGDSGSGKTHLARRLVRMAGEVLKDPHRSLHIETTAEDPGRTYEQFVRKLGLSRVRARVNDYYADIVTAQLQQTSIVSAAAEMLRQREDAPQDAVKPLAMMETALHQEVQKTLRHVTNNDDFGRALTLLLRPGLDGDVWSWLLGGPPSPALADRGITTTIASMADIFEAMGVLALLFGGHERRLLVVIDEFDKIFSAPEGTEQRVLAAFEKMLEVFTKAGACLVLCGRPAFVGTLESSALERVTHTVELSGLTAEQVGQFIKLAQGTRLSPFTEQSIGYLATLTGGIPRRVIRMCHRLFQMSTTNGTAETNAEIDADMVRTAARIQLASLTSHEITAQASRVLDANGWVYMRSRQLGSAQDSRVDFWLPPTSGSGGCAVLITDSVLTTADLDVLGKRVAAIRTAILPVELLVVVNGVVDPVFADQLRSLLDGEPLVYRPHDFPADFKALVALATRWPLSDSSADPQRVVRQRFDQINQQQSNIYGYLGELTDRVDGVRISAERQLGLIEQALSGLNVSVARIAGQDTGDVPATENRLPESVQQLFTDATAVLEEVTQFAKMFGEAITSGERDQLRGIQNRLRVDNYMESAGVAWLLTCAVRAFEDAIRSWYSADEVIDRSSQLPQWAEDTLDEICRSYDAATEYLPVFMLDPLIQLTPWNARGGKLDDASRSSRDRRVHSALENLSPRVRRAVLRSWQGSDR